MALGNNEKYYTPSIEDISIWGIYEFYNNRDFYFSEAEDGWFGRQYIGQYNIATLQFLINKKWVRVPYLTKEQIEGEGWVFGTHRFQNDDLELEDEFREGFEKSIDENTWFILELIPNEIRIEKRWYRNSVAQIWEPIYKGKCPSINEFRKICKLLKII